MHGKRHSSLPVSRDGSSSFLELKWFLEATSPVSSVISFSVEIVALVREAASREGEDH